MSIDPIDLHHEFERLAGTITAPGPIDVGRAVATGHRRAVRRRAAQTGGATAGVAATVALVLTAVHLFGASATATVAVSPTPTAKPSTAAVDDPISNPDSFGWLPKGMQAGGWAFAEPGEPSTTNISGIIAETGGPNSPELKLGAVSGPRPNMPLDTYPVKPPEYTPGPSINGHQSYVESYPGWDTQLGGSGPYYLLWQFDDGTWATLQVSNMTATSALSAQDIVHVARTATEKPFPIPQRFQITGLLADAKVTMAMMPSGTSTTVSMQAGDAEIDIYVQEKAVPGGTCKNASSMRYACVAVRGQLPPSLAAGGVQGLLDDITLLQLSTTDVIKRS